MAQIKELKAPNIATAGGERALGNDLISKDVVSTFPESFVALDKPSSR